MRKLRGTPPKADLVIAFASGTIAGETERREALTRIIRNPQQGPYAIRDVIAAGDQLNRLDRLYVPEQPTPINDNRTQILVGYSEEQLRSLLAAMTGEQIEVREVSGADDG